MTDNAVTDETIQRLIMRVRAYLGYEKHEPVTVMYMTFNGRIFEAVTLEVSDEDK